MKIVFRFLVVLLVAILTACGGGGGGSASLTYDGVATQAVISADNAGDLAAVAYYGSEVDIELPMGVSQDGGAVSGYAEPVPSVLMKNITTLPQSIYSTSLNQSIPRQTISDSMSQFCNEMVGPSSGTMTISGSWNQESGAVSLNFSFSGCNTGDDIIVNGAMGMSTSGIYSQYDLENLDISRGTFNLTFKMLSYEWIGTAEKIVMDGTANIRYDSSNLTQVMEMNLVMQEALTGEMAKLQDYTVTVANVGIEQQVSISGRVYNSTYGYVDITTVEPILIDNFGEAYQGIYRIEGEAGTWAEVDFSISVGHQGSYGDAVGELGTFYL